MLNPDQELSEVVLTEAFAFVVDNQVLSDRLASMTKQRDDLLLAFRSGAPEPGLREEQISGVRVFSAILIWFFLLAVVAEPFFLHWLWIGRFR